MEIDCPNCGSICDVVFEEDQVTEEHPLFCPFCGESVDENYELDDPEKDGSDTENYLDALFKASLAPTEPDDN